MSRLVVQTLLKEAEHLTRAEKIELIDALSKQLDDSRFERLRQRLSKVDPTNLADFFQNSPLVVMELDLTRN
jgi:hypothetical protein